MKKRFAVGALSALMTVSLLGASGASAAVEFGDTCPGDAVAPLGGAGYTLTTLSAPPAALPLIAPSSGVITKLRSNLALPVPFAIPTSVKVLRAAGPGSFTTIDQATLVMAPGLSVGDARLPVLAGDRLGLRGQPFSFEGSPPESVSVYCGEEVGSSLGAAIGDVPPGATANFEPVTAGRVPLVAVIEPDADKDGFGDETQDLCPQSAAFQIACPTVIVDAYSLVGNGAVRILVATSNEAPVQVSGTVKLGKGSKAKLSGGRKGVPPGKLVRFTLKFPGKLKDALKELEPGKKLTLKIVASATNVAGQVSTDKLNAKLKGQG